MRSGRRQKGESRHQGFQGTRSQNKRTTTSNWKPTVPAWEKKFCSTVGAVPWHKVVEAQKFMCLYKNIVDWDDSSGKEAFWNAKNRFWAEINGLHCDISLPDPEEYIDEVNWDSSIDIELLLDLDREPVSVPENDGTGGKIIFGNALLDQSFSCTGWGDCDENFAKDPKVDQWEDNGGCKNSWEDNHNTVAMTPDRDNKLPQIASNSWEDDLDVVGEDQGWDTTGYSCRGWDEFGNDYWNQGDDQRFSGGFGQSSNWSSSNPRNRKHQRGLKRNGTFARALRT